MMKRVIVIIMAIILCMTLIACSNQTPTQTESLVGQSSTSEVVNVTSDKEEKNEIELPQDAVWTTYTIDPFGGEENPVT